MHKARTLPKILIAALVALAPLAAAAPPATLAARIAAIVERPVFKHSLFGIELYSLDTNTPVYTLNHDKLFVPGSTTKLITMGSALRILGADYRFHTRVYR